jgi:hypothetical protein
MSLDVAVVIGGIVAILVGGLAAIAISYARRRARVAGFASVGAYLSAPPRSDAERRDAVDLTLKGVAVCALGLLYPPLLLVGLLPFFFGARKVAYGMIGLGLVDDGDRPGE